MPGMSPRMKAKKGRFLINFGGDPVITVTEPTTATIASPVSASATAIDPETGDVSSFLVWTSSKDGQVGTGANPTLTLSSQQHSLSVSIPNQVSVLVNFTIS